MTRTAVREALARRRGKAAPVVRVAGLVLGVALLPGLRAGVAVAGVAPPTAVSGPQSLLVVAVRFADVSPGLTLPQVRQEISRVDRYVRDASYGKAWLDSRLVGWYEMPAPLGEYRVSPLNYKVDRGRVRRLVGDALAAARRDVDPAAFGYVWIVVGAFTRPGEGYGMIAYAANPGMLSGVRGRKSRLERVDLPGGGVFAGPAIVSAENAHVGHVVHDLLHALGGAVNGERAVPDLYDYDLQSNPPGGRPSPEIFAIHAGPWDIMSQHFVHWQQPPPPPSSFTRLQLGWIGPDQVVTIQPGATGEVSLAPLAQGRGRLVVRIPLGPHRYLLLEKRQRVGGDAVLPSSGLVVLEVDTSRDEGAGIVTVADANPGVPRLEAAPFLPQAGERRAYENRRARVAVTPLAVEPGGELRLVVTTPR